MAGYLFPFAAACGERWQFREAPLNPSYTLNPAGSVTGQRIKGSGLPDDNFPFFFFLSEENRIVDFKFTTWSRRQSPFLDEEKGQGDIEIGKGMKIMSVKTEFDPSELSDVSRSELSTATKRQWTTPSIVVVKDTSEAKLGLSGSYDGSSLS